MDGTDLINGLLTLAGSIMEDSSVMAIMDIGPAGIPERLLALQETGQDLLALARAAEVVRRRYGSDEL